MLRTKRQSKSVCENNLRRAEYNMVLSFKLWSEFIDSAINYRMKGEKSKAALSLNWCSIERNAYRFWKDTVNYWTVELNKHSI